MSLLSAGFKNRLAAGIIASILIVIGITAIAKLNLNQVEQEHRNVNHSQAVIQKSNELLQLVTDAETAARGYFAVKNDSFLVPYHSAISKIDGQYSDLSDLLAGDKDQQKRLQDLRLHITLKIRAMDSYMELRKTESIEAIMRTNPLNPGKLEMELIRKFTTAITTREKEDVAARQNASEEAASRTSVTLMAGAAVFVIIIVALFIYIRYNFEDKAKAEADALGSNTELEKTLRDNAEHNWLLSGLKALAEKMQGQHDEISLGNTILQQIVGYTHASSASIYLADNEQQILNYCAGYAFEKPELIRKKISFGETWIGQVGLNQQSKLLSGQLSGQLSLGTTIVNHPLANSLILPLIFEGELKGVIEIGYREALSKRQEEYLTTATITIGRSLHTLQAQTKLQRLYEEMQQQTEELAVQAEELRSANEQLVSMYRERESS